MKKKNEKKDIKRKILNILLLSALALILIIMVIKPAQSISMNPLQNYTIEEEEIITFEITASEYIGTVLFTKTPSEGTLTKINDSLAEFEWIPGIGDAGTYNFIFTAEDSTNTTSQNSKITVTKKNIPPIITSNSIGNQNTAQVQIDLTTNVDSVCKYSLSDKNYNQMEYSFSALNSERTSHRGKTPSLSQGSHTIYVLCVDSEGNYMLTSTKLYLNINLKPSASISLTPEHPLSEGTIQVELTASEELISAPELKYSFDDDSSLKNVALIGSGKNWEGYIIIKNTDSERVGSFTFKGIDLSNLEGTEITEGKIFLVDTQEPEAIQSISVENQQNRIKIVWEETDEEEVKEYKLYKKTGTGGVEKVDYYASTKDTVFYDKDVDYNQAYYYRVALVDEAGNEGPLSKEAFITHIPLIDSKTGTAAQTSTEEPKKLDPALEYLLIEELKKIDKIQMDIAKAEETLSRTLSSDSLDAIESTNALSTLITNKNKISDLKNNLNNLKNTDLSESEFTTKTTDIMTQINSAWRSTPIEVRVSDSSTYQEFTDDSATESLVSQYITEYYKDLSAKEIASAINDAKQLQGEIIVDVKIIKGEIKFPEETKQFSVIKKTLKTNSELEKAVLFENIPDKIAKPSDIQYSEQPYLREGYVFWNIAPINNKEFFYTIYSDANMADLKSVKSIIFDESNLIKESSDMITGNAAKESADNKKPDGLLLALIISGVLIICGLFAYYVFWSETDGEEKNKENAKETSIQNEEKQTKENQSTQQHSKILDVSSLLFKKRKESIIPADSHKIIEIEKPEESVHTQSDNIEFNRVLNKGAEQEDWLQTKPNTSRKNIKNDLEEFDKLKDDLEELKAKTKIEDLEDLENLRSRTYEIKRKCEEIEAQSIINFSNKTREHLEKSLLYIARNMPPEKRIKTDTETSRPAPSTVSENNENNSGTPKKTIKNAPEWNEFLFANGGRAKSIAELKDRLKEMDQALFESHVSSEKNDFASWIRDVFQEYELAHRVRSAKTKEEMINILEQ
ncbi:MAG: hypothetical protein ACP5N3_04650 [Candidatus Nanoarchaeia archaeon]